MNGADGGIGAAQPWLAGYPGNVDWHAEIPVRPLYALLDEAVARYSERCCIDFLDKRYSYREIGELANRVAKGLRRLGVKRGTKVGLFLPNCPYAVIFYYGILKAGGTVVNFNPLYAERELIHQIEDSDTEIMVTLDLKALCGKLLPLVKKTGLKTVIVCSMAAILPFPKNILFPVAKRKEIARFADGDRTVSFDEVVANDGAVVPPEIDPRTEIALLQYTGGTTGVPKGAMLTHANAVANAMQLRLWAPALGGQAEKILGVLPLFHVFAMTVVMNHGLLLGAEMILLPRFDLKQLLKTIDKKKPTVFVGVPTLYAAINNAKETASTNLRSLKYCISGGAPLPLEVKHRFEELSGCVLVEGYGLSETAPVATCNPFLGENRRGSIGLPLPGTTVEIVAIDGSERVLPAGERGEVCIRGPQVMAGYWKKPEETAKAMRGGRFHSGDIGYIDAEGYIYIVDRLKEMILCGGYNVYPRNVEEAIYMHPVVAECAVIGVADPYRGQTVKAFVVLRGGESVTKDALCEFLKDKLSPIEMPKQIEFRQSLPKTAIGKILKKTLVAEEEAKAPAAA
ncbi:MAG TPA: long-chain fatty acid--CoA ligase [Alphaproteobacteria bacterium]|nr:long-chain fatty acid--CoA ligase [Alphaproteobacteria bacterium]